MNHEDHQEHEASFELRRFEVCVEISARRKSRDCQQLSIEAAVSRGILTVHHYR